MVVAVGGGLQHLFLQVLVAWTPLSAGFSMATLCPVALRTRCVLGSRVHSVA